MAVKLETFRGEGVQVFIDHGVKPRIIRVKAGLDSRSNTREIAYELTVNGEYFRVPRVRVAFDGDLKEPLFDDKTNAEIDGGVLRILFRKDKQRNDSLVKPVS